MEFDTNHFVPVLPIRNTVVFPGLAAPIRVGRPKSIAAVEKAQKLGGYLLTLLIRNEEENKEAIASDLHHVGVLCKIEKIRGSEKQGYQVVLRGVARFRVDNFNEVSKHIEAKGAYWEEPHDMTDPVAKALLESLKAMAKEILKLLPTDTSQLLEMVKGIDDLRYLSYLCAGNIDIPLAQKQAILESETLKSRVLNLMTIMQAQKESLEVQGEIRDRMSKKMGKVQREAILRQHLSAIREELGEDDDSPQGDQYRKRIEEAQMPEVVRKTALEELKRLEALGSSSPESHVIRNYLDLLCALPWTKSAKESIELEEARRILDEDHYGLPKIKKRILQHLAVMKLKNGGKGSILLFVGPPGVGKTSLGQSIARALGRKFVRGSLGGVRDDAEIRGHRRTYIGAMPGRIVAGIKRAGENNPVFMLDEIDKMARGYQGDPASALLEVLDPEQNATFLDHYLDVPFDLSKVLFIATANSLESIPGPLLDRMEVIELSGYTTAEKLHIAKNHLIPKQLGEHGVRADQLAINDDALMRIITHHTREAGVRDLQRNIAAVIRASTERVLSSSGPIAIGLSDLEELIGSEKYIHEVAERVSYPGVVTGLAWTPMGGEILFIEAGLMPGDGKLTITGQLGDVMKESAQIALSLVRANLSTIVSGFGPRKESGFEYNKKDLHIHVPAGGIPKDGPSAGIAILTTLASLYSGRSVDPRLAMTGEVTLRGAVMPVGGIKEKVLAAHRAGIERIILSRRNQRDLKEVPEEVKSQLKFEFVDNISEVLKLTLGIEMSPAAGWSETPNRPAPAVA